jgi:hypothetical protein
MKTRQIILMMAAGMLLMAIASCSKENDSRHEATPFDANGASLVKDAGK